MIKRAVVGIILAACVSAPSWAVTVVSTPQAFNSSSWVVNEIYADLFGETFTNGGLLIDVQAGSIFQQDSLYDSGQPTTRIPGQEFSHPLFGAYGEWDATNDPNGTFGFDSYVADGSGDPFQAAAVAGKSGYGSTIDPSTAIFDENAIDIAWFQTVGGGTGSAVKIGQVTLKVTASGTAKLEVFAGASSPQDSAEYDIVDGVINPTSVPPVVPVPAAVLAGLPLLGLAGIARRRLIG